MRLPAVLLAAAVLTGGCFAASVRPPPPGEIAPRADAVEALADSLAEAPSSAARRAVVVRRLAAAGFTPLAGGVQRDGRYLVGVGTPYVGGFVPGRQPVVRDELVLVGTSLDGPAAPAVLEAGRVLVARSMWETTPGRTVEFVFWSGRTPAREGVAGALRLPTWPRDAVVAVLLVGDDVGPGVEGVPTFAVPSPGAGAALADLVVRRVSELADGPAPPDA